MSLVELILTVCTLTQPAACEERHLSFIAEWANSHPGRKVVKWRCSYPGNDGTPL